MLIQQNLKKKKNKIKKLLEKLFFLKISTLYLNIS